MGEVVYWIAAYIWDLGVDKPNFRQYPPEFPKTCVTFIGHASSRWHYCPLRAIAAYWWGGQLPCKKNLHTAPSFLCCCFSTLCGRSFRPTFRYRKTFHKKLTFTCPGKAKRICSTPLQISGTLGLMEMQPETCLFLNPTFYDRQWTLYCFDTQRPGLGQQPALNSQEHSPQ